MSETPTRKVLVADADEIVAFIASHILSRYDFAVDTFRSAAEIVKHRNGYDAIVVSDAIAAELGGALDPSHAIVLGDDVGGFTPYARLRKPLELDRLVAAVSTLTGRRRTD